MKKSQLKKFDYQIKKDQNYIIEDKVIKTTDINILLNRVRKKKIESKKKLILLISIIGILFLVSILMFVK
mgnify:CR=1 FL=1|jgi:uncharacterized membrane protein